VGFNGFENPSPQNIMGQHPNNEIGNNEFFCSLILHEIDTLDFTYATVFITKASKHANFISILLGSLGVDLVVNPYWSHLSPFDLFQNLDFFPHL
jgi:hypothetical protein